MNTDFKDVFGQSGPLARALPGYAYRPEQASMAGDTDVFVTKWNAAGTGLVYSTYVGGSNRDVALGVPILLLWQGSEWRWRQRKKEGLLF